MYAILLILSAFNNKCFVHKKVIWNALDNVDRDILQENINESDILFKIRIGLGTKKMQKQINRSFRSITTILGNLGGGIKIMVLIGFIIVKPFANLQFQRKMLNEVFNFVSEEKKSSLQVIEDKDNLDVKEHVNEKISSDQKEKLVHSKENTQLLLASEILAVEKMSPIKEQENSGNYQVISHNEKKMVLIKQGSMPIQSEPFLMIPNNGITQGATSFFARKLRTEVKSKSIVPSIERSIFAQEQNDDVNNSSNNLSTRGKKANNFKDFIRETILNNSQKKIQNNSFEKTEIELLQKQKNQTNEKKKKKEDNDIFEKHFRTTYNPLKLSFFQQVFYFIWPFGKYKRTKEKIRYSIKQLNHHLDSLYIVKKLLEVDKLKMLLLNEDQIKLLEFLPKPTIDLTQIRSQQYRRESLHFGDQQNINILYQDTRNDLTRATQAFRAFNSIKAKSTLSKIDQRLIQLLDPKIANYFNFQDYDLELANTPLLGEHYEHHQNNHNTSIQDAQSAFFPPKNKQYQYNLDGDNKQENQRPFFKKASMFKKPIQGNAMRRYSKSIQLPKESHQSYAVRDDFQNNLNNKRNPIQIPKISMQNSRISRKSQTNISDDEISKLSQVSIEKHDQLIDSGSFSQITRQNRQQNGRINLSKSVDSDFEKKRQSLNWLNSIRGVSMDDYELGSLDSQKNIIPDESIENKCTQNQFNMPFQTQTKRDKNNEKMQLKQKKIEIPTLY